MSLDCFLSHNSKDKKAVRALAAVLRQRGLAVWLDEEQLRPGTPSQRGLESGILAARTVAVLVGADGLGPWELEEQEAAISLAVRDNRPVIPVLLGDAKVVPELPLLLRNRTWVDLRAGAGSDSSAGIDRLIWGITGRNLAARGDRSSVSRRRERSPSKARHSAAEVESPVSAEAPGAGYEPRGSRRRSAGATRLDAVATGADHEQATTAIAESLEAVPVLYGTLAKQPFGAGAANARDLALRLCGAHGHFPAALNALVAALPEAKQQTRQRGEELALLRQRAREILGWVTVTTVLDGYDREDSERIRAAWLRGGAFHIPLGRSPCIEVLTARWRGRRAEFSTEPKRYDYGADDITPERFGEIGFDDPRRLDHERAVSYVWRRVYQDIHGTAAPERLPPAKIRDLRAWLDRQLEHRRRLRLVIDRYDLDQAFAFESTLQAIHEAIPQIHLIVIDSGAVEDPGVFVLPASDLAAGIYDCLKTIEDLA